MWFKNLQIYRLPAITESLGGELIDLAEQGGGAAGQMKEAA